MPFTFKQFHIDDQNCGMPVSTDAVVLGAWASLESASRILDIGAGSGLLSLMAAQRTAASITAVELDADAACVCRKNMAASPWPDRLSLVEGDIRYLADELSGGFDHIICNPPYFETGPQSEKQGRASARHTGSLPFSALIAAIDKLLSDKGLVSLILPLESLPAWQTALADCQHLVQSHICNVISVRGKAPKRALLQLSRPLAAGQTESVVKTELIIRETDNSYSQQMTELTRDFYLFMS